MIYGLLSVAQTPIFTVIDGTSHIIKSGTVVSMDGLVLTPSKDFSLMGKNLTRKSTASNAITNPNIKNYYAFNGTTNAFTGTVKFNYSDAELNGLIEANLKLNIFIPSTWFLQQNTTINTTDNFTTNTLSAVSMKELTLGYLACAPTSVVATNNFQTICTGTSMASITLTDALNPTGTTYSWTRTNTGNVTGISSTGTGSTICGTLVNATTTAQSTVFTITAKRTNGCSSTTTATVTVNPKPSITKQPANTSKYATQIATFSITAAGLPSGYQWQQLTTAYRASWVNISNGGIYGGATTNTLTLSGVTVSMNGYKYRCVVTGQCSPSIISNAATLSVSKTSTSSSVLLTSNPMIRNTTGEDNKTSTRLSLQTYPNPTLGKFKLIVNNFNIDKATVRISDARGRLIMAKEVNIASSKHTLPLSINGTVNGSFIIQVSQADKSASVVVVKE
jgi:hypothetical protein